MGCQFSSTTCSYAQIHFIKESQKSFVWFHQVALDQLIASYTAWYPFNDSCMHALTTLEDTVNAHAAAQIFHDTQDAHEAIIHAIIHAADQTAAFRS